MVIKLRTMKWIKIITEFQSYKWYLFTCFAIPFTVGFILKALGRSPAIPTLIFVGELVIWLIIWIIATIKYRKWIKNEKL